jgi:hypothetical protein
METCTPGSASGSQKRTGGNTGTALRADSTTAIATQARSAGRGAVRQVRVPIHIETRVVPRGSTRARIRPDHGDLPWNSIHWRRQR